VASIFSESSVAELQRDMGRIAATMATAAASKGEFDLVQILLCRSLRCARRVPRVEISDLAWFRRSTADCQRPGHPKGFELGPRNVAMRELCDFSEDALNWRRPTPANFSHRRQC